MKGFHITPLYFLVLQFMYSSILLPQNHFQTVWASPYLPMNIYVTGGLLAGGGSLGVGDEIGVFDGSVCVGAVLLTGPINPYVSIIASTDDPITPTIDGFVAGHTISYKFWISSTSIEFDQYIPDYTIGNGTFVSQGTVVVSFTNIFPVELTSFEATIKENEIELRWETITEVNNYGFNVERRIDEGEWNSIGFVEGNGNSNSPKHYTFVDKNPFGGSVFAFRLKQIDTDGAYEYSTEVEVELLPRKYELYQNYPNPFNPVTNIKFSLPVQIQLMIKLYNMLGEQVATIAEGTYPSGYHMVTFNANNLPSGTYIYRLESSKYVQVKKMLLLK